MDKRNSDPLASMRRAVREKILEEYPTVEQFCWDKDLNKATVSNFLRSKKEFQISTLVKMAAAVGMKLVIRLK